MKLKIIRTSGPDSADGADTRFLETGRIVLGRGAGCDWPLPDPERTLSKAHCELAFQGNVYVLRDTSTNGVFVNGASQPLGRGKTMVLKHGDTFRAADFTFQVEVVTGDETGEPRPRRADPGSPIDKLDGLAGGQSDPFDAFGAAPAGRADGGLFGSAAADLADDDWGRDPGSMSGFGGSEEFGGGGFGAADFPDPPATGQPAASIPDDLDLSPVAPAPTDDSWAGGAAMPTGSTPDPRLTSVTATLLETAVRLSRLNEDLARLMDLPATDQTADRLPVTSGEGMVEHLLSLPDDQASEVLKDLTTALVSHAEQMRQALEMRAAYDQAERPASTPGKRIPPLEDDPFG